MVCGESHDGFTPMQEILHRICDTVIHRVEDVVSRDDTTTSHKSRPGFQVLKRCIVVVISIHKQQIHGILVKS